VAHLSPTDRKPWARTTPVNVETEQNVIRAFSRVKQPVNTDLQNAKDW
jgi:hypothetical protein